MTIIPRFIWKNTKHLFLLTLILLISSNLIYAQKNKDGLQEFRTNARSFSHLPRTNDAALNQNANCNNSVFRTIDGTCNNTSKEARREWGASDIALRRSMNSEYANTDVHNDMGGEKRKSARAISNLIVSQSEDTPSGVGLSAFVYSWGQFIDHDIDLTPEGHSEYEPVLLPANEPLFTSEIPFFRSEVFAGTGTSNPREQINLISSWIDASNVYGSEATRANWLRTFVDGKLKVSTGNLLPYNTLDGEKNGTLDPDAPSMAGDGGGTVAVFVAGDVRGVEQPTLTALHTLFVREHNRICDELKQQGYADDEFIYQVARKRIGAYLQAITFEHFLPALGIYLRPYASYRPDVRPDISNLFASAAYRLGHTMVTSELWLRDDDCEAIGLGKVSLAEAFFNPSLVEDHDIDPILKGISMQVQQEVDVKIVDELRNFLFPVPGSPVLFGLDLASLNIQRGRDHGLPDYNEVRRKYLGFKANGFGDITNDPSLRNALSRAYDGKINDIDPWVGLLSEKPIPGSSVGATLSAVLADQFQRLRDADYFYFAHDPFFSNQDRDRIRSTSLRDIILRNTDLTDLPENVFFAGSCRGGHGGNNGPGRPGHQGDGRSMKIEALSNSLFLFPNPATDFIQVQFEPFASTGEVQLKILSITGQAMYQRNFAEGEWPGQLELEVANYAAGTYLLEVKTEGEVLVKKWVRN